jgi:O-antigen/teichoic acid export membrane protein
MRTKWSDKLSSLIAGSLGEELSRGAVQTLVLRLVFVALEFLCVLALARVFKASGYGVYAAVLSWVALLAIPAVLGFDRLVIREIATLVVRSEWPLMRGLLRRSSQIVLFGSTVLAAAVAIGASLGTLAPESESVIALQIGMLAVPLVALARVRAAALVGLGRVALGQLPEMLLQPLAMLCLIGAVYLTSASAQGGRVAVFLYVLSAAIAFMAGALILRKELPETTRTIDPAYQTGRWIRSATPFVWMLGMNAIMINIDTVMVSVFAGTTAAGTYRVASQMAMFIVLPMTCVNMAFASPIATLYARGDLQTLRGRAWTGARAVLIGAMFIALLLVAFGRPVLGAFGPDFVAGYPALLILIGGYLLAAASGVAGYVLIMTNYETAVAVISALGAGMNVVGNLVLIPLWGINGAAGATALSTVAVSLAFAVLAYRALGIRSYLLSWR